MAQMIYYLSSFILIVLLSAGSILIFSFVIAVFWAAVKEAWSIIKYSVIQLLKNKKNR